MANSKVLRSVIENEKKNGKIIIIAAHNLSNDLLDLFDYQIQIEKLLKLLKFKCNILIAK